MRPQIGSCSFVCLVLSCMSAAPAPDAEAREQPGAVDRLGDPLPGHARARLGSSRFHHGAPLHQVFYVPDGKSLVAIDTAGLVRVWDAATGRIIGEIGAPKGAPWMISSPREIALSPDGKMLAMIESEQPARFQLWDFVAGRERRRWHPARGEVYHRPTFSSDGRTVAVGVRRFDEMTNKSDSFIDLWETAAPTERRRRLTGDWTRLWDLRFSPDGKSLAAATRDTELTRGNILIGADKGSIRLWDLATGRERSRLPVDRVDALSLAFSPDGKRLAAAISEGTVRLYDLTDGLERGPRLRPERAGPIGGNAKGVPSRPRAVGCLAFSPDGTILAGGDAYQQDFSMAAIHLWDVARSGERHRIPAHRQWVASLSFAPDGKTLASAGAEPVIGLWDVATGREAFPRVGHRSAIRSLALSPTDGTVFTGGDDGTIRRWDPSSGRELGLIARFEGPVEASAIAPDGQTLLVIIPNEPRPRRSSDLGLWSVAEHRLIRRLASIGGRENVHYVALSRDGKRVASGGQVRDISSGEVLVTLRHQDPKLDRFFGFSPIFLTSGPRQVITVEPDGVRIWDAATGWELRQAVRWSNHHDHAVLSPDGRLVATMGPGPDRAGADADLPIILWELASGQEVARLEAHGDDAPCRPFAFSRDGRLLASAAGRRGAVRGSTVRIWDVASGRGLRQFTGHRGAVNAVAFASDGRWVVSASEDAMGLIWDLSDLRGKPHVETSFTREAFSARWDELAGDDARVTHRATWALSVPSTVAFLGERLRPAGSPDAPGIPAASGPIAPPQVLQILRAIAALEHVGTPDARIVLERMVRGDPGAIQTREAKAALDRLDQWSRAR